MEAILSTPPRGRETKGSLSPTGPEKEMEMTQSELLSVQKSFSDLSSPRGRGEQPEAEASEEDKPTAAAAAAAAAAGAISLFDRKALLRRLHEAQVPIKQRHLEMFYEALHRNHYPPLKDFMADHCRKLVARRAAATDCSLSVSSDESGSTIKPLLPSKYRRLSPHLIRFFADNLNSFETVASRIVSTTTSKSGNATSIDIEMQDGHVVETMLMRYNEESKNGGVGGGRASVSLATQVGCSHPCVYGLNSPFVRNLSTAELLEQVVHATRVLVQENSDQERRHLIQNVAFMGTGEPLDNYDNVVEACQILSDSNMWGLRRGRITISTIGITPRIYDLTRDLPDVILAVSLHAPNQQLRRTIVPAAEHYQMVGLMEAIDNHMESLAQLSPRAAADADDDSQASSTTRRRNVMLEYILGKWFNVA
jgi:adenine C2-methylase RlmN of 23S rRNA A2503 and tRNA A37